VSPRWHMSDYLSQKRISFLVGLKSMDTRRSQAQFWNWDMVDVCSLCPMLTERSWAQFWNWDMVDVCSLCSVLTEAVLTKFDESPNGFIITGLITARLKVAGIKPTELHILYKELMNRQSWPLDKTGLKRVKLRSLSADLNDIARQITGNDGLRTWEAFEPQLINNVLRDDAANDRITGSVIRSLTAFEAKECNFCRSYILRYVWHYTVSAGHSSVDIMW